MRTIRSLLVRLFNGLHRARREQELRDELDTHLQTHIDDNLRAGMRLDEARRPCPAHAGRPRPDH